MLTIHCTKLGSSHTHSTFGELALCAGDGVLDVTVTPRPTPVERPVAASTAPASGVTIRRPTDPPSVPQLNYIDGLGGSWRDAATGNKAEASVIINSLKDPVRAAAFKMPEDDALLEDDDWEAFPMERKWRKGELPSWIWGTPEGWESHRIGDTAPGDTESEEDPDPEELSIKSKLQLMLPLLERVPEGYYCTDLGDGSPLRFYRISRPKRGEYKNTTKVQSQHADRLRLAWCLWPQTNRDGTPRISVFSKVVEDDLLTIIADYAGCARRYAKKLNRCCRCRIELTDERSRHYGIGPECEKHYPWIIEMVDLEDALKAEEAHG